jgi:hypothetical protein
MRAGLTPVAVVRAWRCDAKANEFGLDACGEGFRRQIGVKMDVQHAECFRERREVEP